MFDEELTERQLQDLVTDQEIQLEKQENELYFLRWYYIEADFGPAHEAVVNHYKTRFIKETSRPLPKGYAQPFPEE